MKTLAIALLLLASCAASLPSQALVVVTASQVVAPIGSHIQAQSDAAFDAAKTPDAKLAVYQKWAPIVASYSRVKTLVLAYESAIAAADARGDKTLLGAPAQALVAEWVKLAGLAADAGIEVPGPPSSLTSLAGAL